MQNFSLGWRLTFANLWFCGSSREIFSPRNWGAWHPWRDKSEQSAPAFSAKIVFFINLPSFLPQSFRCTVLPRLHDPVADWISGKDRRLAQRSHSLARCGWLAILRGWAGEPCKTRVSPEKSGWVGRSALRGYWIWRNWCHFTYSRFSYLLPLGTFSPTHA